PFPGFSTVFRAGLASADEPCRISLHHSVDEAVATATRPHLEVADHLTRAITALSSLRSQFDVLLIYLPVRWSAAFRGADDDFDLHDYLKAFTATAAVPMQIIREDSALAYPCRCSVAWRLGIALYCKAGGVPWKLAQADPDIAYVGISYAIRQLASGPQFV